MHPRWWKKSVVRLAISLYVSGLSASEVSREIRRRLGRAPAAKWVYEQVAKAGVSRRRASAMRIQNAKRYGRDFDAIRVQAVKLAEEKLWSVRMIARYLDTTDRTVRKALPEHLKSGRSEAGTKRCWQAYTPEVERRRALADWVVELRGQGLRYEDITRETGLAPATVYRYLRERGAVVQPWRERGVAR